MDLYSMAIGHGANAPPNANAPHRKCPTHHGIKNALPFIKNRLWDGEWDDGSNSMLFPYGCV
jgi:hypothetical protein